LRIGYRRNGLLLAVYFQGREDGRRFIMIITDRIEINPKVMMGKPVIRGTRIPVELILRKLSEGAKERELLEAYPRLTKQDIQAAIRYAADTLAHEDTVILSSPKRAARK
jgi:uncharacterized protein (DUF433 family)